MGGGGLTFVGGGRSTEGEFFKVRWGGGEISKFLAGGGTPPISSSPQVGKTLKDNVPG